MRCRASAWVLVLCVLCLPARASPLDVTAFSSMREGGDIGAGWAPLTFRNIERRTRYALVADGGTVVVRADADASASGLVYRLDAPLEARPRLTWRWKIDGVVAAGDPRRKDGDDYAARVYVTFRYEPTRLSALDRAKYALARQLDGEYPPHAGIAYVWDARLPPGTVLPNAYTDRVKMIVVRSGADEAGRWMEESRDVLEDYRRAFGEAPPPVSGVALMTDTDQTGGRATAWYGDLRFLPAP
jgi:hypothetical protein